MKEFQTAQQTLDFLRSLVNMEQGRENDHGCMVYRGFDPCDRYLFDFHVCTPSKGWHQYDTDQDAHYFGVWYNVGLRVTFSYVEGDFVLVESPTVETFKAEMAHAAAFYGNPPPAFVGIDTTTGEVTHFFDENARPDLSSL